MSHAKNSQKPLRRPAPPAKQGGKDRKRPKPIFDDWAMILRLQVLGAVLPATTKKALKVLTLRAFYGSGGRDRTYDQLINSPTSVLFLC